MDDRDVIRRGNALKRVNAIPDRLLARRAARHNLRKLVDAELLGIGPHHVVPALNAYHYDVIHVGMTLKRLERIDEHGLVVDVDELLGDVLPHTRTGASGDDHRVSAHKRDLSIDELIGHDTKAPRTRVSPTMTLTLAAPPSCSDKAKGQRKSNVG